IYGRVRNKLIFLRRVRERAISELTTATPEPGTPRARILSVLNQTYALRFSRWDTFTGALVSAAADATTDDRFIGEFVRLYRTQAGRSPPGRRVAAQTVASLVSELRSRLTRIPGLAPEDRTIVERIIQDESSTILADPDSVPLDDNELTVQARRVLATL